MSWFFPRSFAFICGSILFFLACLALLAVQFLFWFSFVSLVSFVSQLLTPPEHQVPDAVAELEAAILEFRERALTGTRCVSVRGVRQPRLNG